MEQLCFTITSLLFSVAEEPVYAGHVDFEVTYEYLTFPMSLTTSRKESYDLTSSKFGLDLPLEGTVQVKANHPLNGPKVRKY